MRCFHRVTRESRGSRGFRGLDCLMPAYWVFYKIKQFPRYPLFVEVPWFKSLIITMSFIAECK